MSNMPLSFENLQKFFLIQTLAFRVSASRTANVFVYYSGHCGLISLSVDSVNSVYSDRQSIEIFPALNICLGVHSEAEVSGYFDRFISFLNSLLSESVNPDALALTHEAAFNAAQMPLL